MSMRSHVPAHKVRAWRAQQGIVEPLRRFVIDGHPGARMSRHGDGALTAVQVVESALEDEGLIADTIDVIERRGESIVVVARHIRRRTPA